MPLTWNSTVPSKMCTCISPRYDLAWECPRCHKINAPWKDSCSCTPSQLSSAPISGTQSSKYLIDEIGHWNFNNLSDPKGPRPSSHDLNKNFTDK